jgi:hypothetical protein
VYVVPKEAIKSVLVGGRRHVHRMDDLHFLIGHELEERSVLSEETVLLKLLDRELGETVVKNIKLNPFLL